MCARVVPQASTGRLAFVLAIVLALVAGFLGGRGTAYAQSVGGMTAAFGPVPLVIAGLAMGVVAVVVRLVGRLLGAQRTARQAVVAGALAFVVGATVGFATAAATGATYAPPVIRSAGGTAVATIGGGPASFTQEAGGEVSCQAAPDTDALESVTARNLGELGPGTLNGTLWFDLDGTPRLSLAIDDVDLADPGTVTWSGPVALTDLAVDKSTGTASFTELPLLVDEKLPPPPDTYDGPLSGSFTWACDPLR